MHILGLFDAVVVEVEKNLLLFRLALAILWLCNCMEGLTKYTGEQFLVYYWSRYFVFFGRLGVFLKPMSFKSHNSMLDSGFSTCDTQGVLALKFLISDPEST